MKVKLIRKWGEHYSGEILEPAPSLARLLIRKGYAEPAGAETATVEPTEDAMDRRPQPRNNKGQFMTVRGGHGD